MRTIFVYKLIPQYPPPPTRTPKYNYSPCLNCKQTPLMLKNPTFNSPRASAAQALGGSRRPGAALRTRAASDGRAAERKTASATSAALPRRRTSLPTLYFGGGGEAFVKKTFRVLHLAKGSSGKTIAQGHDAYASSRACELRQRFTRRMFGTRMHN